VFAGLSGFGLFQFFNKGKVIEAYLVTLESKKEPPKEATKL
jgi:hypothetical protein